MTAVNVDRIPDELKEHKQWISWKLVDGKKIPINPFDRSPAKTSDSRTWSGFGHVSQVYKESMGFVFTADDPYIGVDLDKCIDKETGEIAAEAQRIVDLLDSYTEVSQSGTGLHIIIKGNLPREVKTPGLEIYSKGRYFIMTGNHYPGTPLEINTRQREIESIIPEPKINGHHIDGEKISTGGRDNALTSEGGKLRRAGLNHDEILTVLLRKNEEDCDPPLDEKDVRRIAASVSRYEKGKEKPKKDKEFIPRTEGWEEELTGEWKPKGDKLVCFYHRTTYNLEVMIRNMVNLEYDEFAQREIVNGEPRQDHLTTRVTSLIGKRYYLEFTAGQVAAAIASVAREKPFNPVADKLNAFADAWDGTPRLETWLYDWGGADAYDGRVDFFRQANKRFMISLVARALKPGCKVDTMIVLESKQGIGKSTTGRIICEAVGPGLFSDALPSLRFGTKEAVMHLRNKWIVEIAELSATRAAFDVETVKAFISGQDDSVRLSHHRDDTRLLRTCVFIGTTNNYDWQSDTTGGRRFWPIQVKGHVDIKGLTEIMPQLLGEAVVRFRKGERWWFDHESEQALIQEAQAAQEERMPVDALEEPILDFAERPYNASGFKPEGLLDEWLVAKKDWNAMIGRVRKVLLKHGYESKVCRDNGKLVRLWKKTDDVS